MCSIACGHTPIPILPEGGVVVLHVKQCLQTCCFVVFILVPYHTHIQSLLAPLASYVHKYAPIIMYGLGLFIVVLTRTTMLTLHAGLANPTCLQSFMIWYCLVSELRCLNSKKKKKEKKMKNWCLWENRHFLFNPFPMHEFT